MPDEITDGGAQMVEVHIMGQRYRVPASLTIMKAFEYAGYRLVRGVGCRGGFCGACGTVYRVGDDYHLRFALACQTVVEDGMYLTQIPSTPRNGLTTTLPTLSRPGRRSWRSTRN
ncbi:MAG: 2Fe-2S iron-sulfur cluster binding domain-containing protein [Anaerolineae bacterium]|nr:2Fe-2S iron-sulfur cluster binding domain-containing protein [Anaerolineae bacterium]